MRKQVDKPDRIVARIARRQHGVVRYDQLTWAGMVPSMITRRVKAGHLHRLYRGVHAVGHTDLTREGRWIAAVFACGEGAVLSHASAAAAWRLSPTCPPLAHVTVPGTTGRARRQQRTRSDLERLFLRICREHGIPEPEVNGRIGPHEVDFLWREARLIVEVDSYRYHSNRATLRTDRARDRELGRRGLTVMRFADVELDGEPKAVAASLLARLRC